MVNTFASHLAAAHAADVARAGASPARYWSRVDAGDQQPADRPDDGAPAARGRAGGRFHRPPVARLRGGWLRGRADPPAERAARARPGGPRARAVGGPPPAGRGGGGPP